MHTKNKGVEYAVLYGGELHLIPLIGLMNVEQAWLQTTCREYRRRTVAIRSRTSADCTTGVWRTWRM